MHKAHIRISHQKPGINKILKTLFKHCFNPQSTILASLEEKHSTTHPPAEFRIYKLLNEWKHVEHK